MLTRREVISFRVAMAAIAVAVIDDAFVHREHGTAVTGQLVSGLVPVCAAAVLGWGYPRMRTGARGWTAIVCGLLAAVAGVAVGLGSSALIAGVAGIALVIGGTWRLWHGRRRDGRPIRRRALTGVVAVVAGFFVVLPVCVAIVATHKARSTQHAAFGQPVMLRTDDGLKLTAAYAPSRNGAAVIVFPGRTAATVARGRLLSRHGYGVLLLDRRGEGTSDGRLNRLGWNGEGDVRAALDFLSRRPDVQRIGGLGLSVGGELLLQAAAHDPRLQAVVSEGAGVRSLREHLRTPGLGVVQRWGTTWIAQTAAVAVLSDTLPPPDLTTTVERLRQRPVLLIRAARGHEDEALNDVYAARIGSSATEWTAPGSHTGALDAAPGEYERRIIAFFDDSMRVR